jgi:outer membrane lipoprotein SlyB
MKIYSIIALAVISLAGCANTETYKMYAEGQAKVDESPYIEFAVDV